MKLDPYVAALVAGFAVSLTVAVMINLSRRRFVALPSLGGLIGGSGQAAPLGGLALLAGFALAPIVAAALSDRAAEYFNPKRDEFLGFMAAAGFVFATGLLDDWRPMRPWQKICGQLVAGAAVFAAGYRLEVIGLPWGADVDLGLLALPVTLLWVVFFTNALNLVDGKDGLATGVAVLASLALAAVAANTDHPAVALLFVGLAGAGLGFLPFNLPSATLFLGDAGALLLGFVLSALSIRGATGAEGSVFIAVPLLAMGFPLLDTLLSVTRRLLDGRSPFTGDLDHIHHRSERLGLGRRASLLLLYAVAGAFAAAALLTHYLESVLIEGLVLVALVTLIGLLLVRLGYATSLWDSQRLLSLRAWLGSRRSAEIRR